MLRTRMTTLAGLEGVFVCLFVCFSKKTFLVKGCGTLDIPSHGSVSYSCGTISGSIATFSCDTGYTLSGATTRTCQTDRSWSNDSPTCEINGIFPLKIKEKTH